MLTNGLQLDLKAWISKPSRGWTKTTLSLRLVHALEQNKLVHRAGEHDVESLGRLRALVSSTDMALHLGALAGYKTKTYAKAHTAKTGSALTTRGMEAAECPQRP